MTGCFTSFFEAEWYDSSTPLSLYFQRAKCVSMSICVCVYLSVSQSASREGEFRESDDCSLLLFRWLALTPQAPSG